MFCGRCGAVIDAYDKFCNKCGAELVPEERERLGENTTDILEWMIGDNVPHYMSTFKQIEYTGKGQATALGMIWGWWMLYRKMYREFFLYYSIVFVSTFIPVIGSVVSIGFVVYMCCNLNRLYYESVKRKIKENHLENATKKDSYQFELLVKKIGGTSMLSVVIWIGITLLMNTVMYMYLYG